MILMMVGLAEWTNEKEILFPEMTALIIGLLIIDKRVWNVKRWHCLLYTSRAHETRHDLVCRLLLEKKQK